MLDAYRPAPDLLARIEREVERDSRLASANTRRGYLADLAAFEAWRRGRTLTKRLAEEYAVHLRQSGLRASSINRALAAVRWWARRVGDLAYEEPLPKAQREEFTTQARRVAEVRNVRGDDGEPAGRHLADSEVAALLAACLADRRRTAGARDAALIALAWSTGARRSEIAGVDVADVARGTPVEIVLRKTKGKKVRSAYLYDARYLSAWLKRRGDRPGPLFLAVTRGGVLRYGQALSGEGLAKILRKRALEAALAQEVTWHDFRRTFAGNLLSAGVDIATVQQLMGHSKVTTTADYDRRGEDARRAAAALLKLPGG